MRWVICLLLLSVPAAAAAQSRAERDVLAVNEAFDRAIVARDAAYYARILADEFVFTNFEGVVTGKAEEIARMKAGTINFTSGKSDDVRVRIYGNTHLRLNRNNGRS